DCREPRRPHLGRIPVRPGEHFLFHAAGRGRGRGNRVRPSIAFPPPLRGPGACGTMPRASPPRPRGPLGVRADYAACPLRCLMPHLLLIVDDPRWVSYLRKALEEKGHHVHSLDEAEPALDLLQDGAFDLALVDYSLPGMTGIEFLAALRERGISIP